MGRKRKPKTQAEMPVMRTDAAGIDVGAMELYVAVPADRDPEPVRCFPTFTQDLYALADWLEQCQIKTVAMESTSDYWIPVFQILEARGIGVCLVNARHVKNVPRTQDGRLGLPMATVLAFSGATAGIVPTRTSRMQRAVAVAASGEPGPDGRDPRSSHAESTRSDESSTDCAFKKLHRRGLRVCRRGKECEEGSRSHFNKSTGFVRSFDFPGGIPGYSGLKCARAVRNLPPANSADCRPPRRLWNS